VTRPASRPDCSPGLPGAAARARLPRVMASRSCGCMVYPRHREAHQQ
jgi:hypothetical protein